MTCPQRHLVDEHFAHRTDAAREQALREHLPGCAECNARYERHLLFGQLTGQRAARDRLLRPFGLTAAARPRWARVLVPALAASLTLVVAGALLLPRTDGFTARGKPPSGVGLQVFRVEQGKGSTKVGDTLSARDALAFSVQNAAGKKWLMVFAVDAAGRVYWYHPGWENAAETPQAVPLETSAAWRELPDAVTQPLSPGTLELHALFLDERLDVKQVEASLGQPVPGALEVRRTVEVTP